MAHRKAKSRSTASAQKGAAARPAVNAVPTVKAEAKPVPAAPAPAAKVETAPAPVAPAAPVAPVVEKTEAVPAAIETRINIATEQRTKTMTKQTNTATETGAIAADRIQAAIGDVNARAQVAAEKGTKLLEEATELTKGNVEALVASSKIAAKGVETLGQDAAEYGRKSFEEASAALKSFAEVKSPTDFFKLQSDYARSAFDSMVAESAKVSEAMIKLAGEVAEPITSRYSVAAERVKTLAL